MKKTFTKQFLIFLGLSIPLGILLTPSRTVGQGFSTVTPISAVSSDKNTGEKPQSKVWKYDGKWWGVFPDNSSTYVWRLDGSSWTSVLKISSKTSIKADCKVVGDVVHILLWRKSGSSSELVSVEYDPANSKYNLWSNRTATAYIDLDNGTETGTIDIDGNGRMWLASDGTTTITVRWSDFPYSNWSSPITIATGITTDDISTVIAMPVQGQIGVFWSDQNTKRFGFKTHQNGADPSSWSANEVPASQSAVNIGNGMGDDHLNVKAASDGTLYCAVKTSYDTPGYPKISLLKRRPNGVWDNLYEVSQEGTRGVVILNENTGRLKVVFTSQETGGDILYKESSMSTISFGPVTTLISGTYDNASSSKNSYDPDIVIIAADHNVIVGVLCSDASVALPQTPVLVSPANLATDVPLNATLSWNAATNATGYHVQVSTLSNFSSTVFDQSNIAGTSVQPSGLANNTLYYWRVQSSNSGGSSAWSGSRSFTTIAAQQLPAVPVLVSPANLATGVAINPTLSWNVAANATSYHVQVSTVSNFASTILDQSNISTTSVLLSSLLNNTLYYWRVESSNAGGPSGWSAPWSFTTIAAQQPPAVPVLVSPANLATGVAINPTLSWNAAANAASYHVQVSTVSNFASTILDQSNISTTSVLLGSLINNTVYYWRVESSNSVGNSGWAAAWSFTTVQSLQPPATPTLLAPANLATNVPANQTVSWSTVANATSYHLQVATVSNFSSTVLDQSNIATTSLQLSLATNTLYYWRVQSTNSAGSSSYTAAWSFTTIQTPAAPTLLSPANLATGVAVDPTLSWNASAGATSYQAQVSTASNFASTVFDQSNIVATSAQLSGLINNTLYYWRVLGSNAAGNSAWSAVRSFTTEASTGSGDNLVANWLMNEGSGPTLFDNTSFTNNAQTVGGPTWVSGKVGLALHLNGNSQYASVPDAPSLDITQAITLAAWIRPGAKQSQRVLQKGTTVDGYLLNLLSTGKVSFEFNQISSSNYKLNSSTLYPTNGTTWMHVAATYDGMVIRVYINGVEDKSATVGQVMINTNALPLMIGAKNDGGAAFQGDLDDIRVYNYALSASEISNLFTVPEGGGGSGGGRIAANDIVAEPVQLTESDLSMKLYPNPTDDILHIEFGNMSGTEMEISISDQVGRMYFKTIEIVKNDMTINLNDMNLRSGLYFLTTKSAKYFKTTKLIKR